MSDTPSLDLVRGIALTSAEFTLYVWFGDSESRLQASLRTLLRELRALELPPERVLAILKAALPWERLDRPRPAERIVPAEHDPRAACDRTISWCIGEFFRDEARLAE